MADGQGNYFSNNLCCVPQVSHGLEFLSMSIMRLIASTSISGRGQNPQFYLLQQGTTQSKALFPSTFSSQAVLPFHQDFSALPSSKCYSSADRVQHPEHALSLGTSFVRGLLRLYNQDELEREVQPILSYPLPLAGDVASCFKQGQGKGAHPYFLSLGWSIQRSRLRISSMTLTVDFEQDMLWCPLPILYSLLVINPLLCGAGRNRRD